MTILSAPGTVPARPWHRGDHCLFRGLRYVVLGLDLSDARRVQLAKGDDADHPGSLGRIFAPISKLVWRA